MRNGPKTQDLIERQWVEMGEMIQEMREELDWDG
jgi:hypothetical protein